MVRPKMTLCCVPIVVRLQNEFRRPVTVADPDGGTFDWTDDIDRLIPFGDPTFRCLDVIDPYGDTVFNQLQIPCLLEGTWHGSTAQPQPRSKSEGYDAWRPWLRRA